jgi:hypothetical protein
MIRRNKMKINRRQLRNLIAEEMKKTTDLAIAHDDTADVKAQEDTWAGGQNIHWDKDHTDDLIEAMTSEELRNFVLSELKSLV